MKKLFILFSIFCCVNMPQNLAIAAPNSSQVSLSNIESQVFGYEYKGENDGTRLTRLENFLYGKVQTGSNEARIKKLSSDAGIIDSTELATTGEAGSTGGAAPTNVPMSKKYAKEDPSVEYPIIDEIEQTVFNRNYNGENVYARVERLEKQVYKTTNGNDDLSNRVNKLRLSVIKTTPNVFDEDTYPVYSDDDEIISDHTAESYPTRTANSYNYSSPSKSRNNYQSQEITALEQLMLKQSYPRENENTRLDRLENKIFKRSFSNDDNTTRIDRISAASTAKKSSQLYDNNKLMRNLTTGAQIGGILLMILAMIL
ncbi:MAG: hypothetical protein PHV37_02805 [Candidatus Gastranaerophilales bacterium]|nr:hypothetical protein [Candidatus Gastranaerophilales bacterium]